MVEEEAVYHGMDEAELLTQHRELAASFLAGENFALVDELAERVVGTMKESMVMPTALVAPSSSRTAGGPTPPSWSTRRIGSSHPRGEGLPGWNRGRHPH